MSRPRVMLPESPYSVAGLLQATRPPRSPYSWVVPTVAALVVFTLSGCGGSTGGVNEAPAGLAGAVSGAGSPRSIAQSDSAQVTPITLLQHANKDAGTTGSSSLAFPANNTA